MKFRSLVFLDFRLLMREKIFYIKLILFPLLLIAILGFVFDTHSNVKIEPFTVLYLNSDQPSGAAPSDSLGTVFENTALKNSEVQATIEVTEVSSDSQANQLLRDGKASVYIRIPKDFTDRYFAGKSTEVQVNTENASTVQKQMINSIIRIFIQTVDMQKNLQTAVGTEAGVLHADAGSLKQALSQLNTSVAQANLPVSSPNGDRQPVSSMQYYAVAMTLMFSILTALTLIHSIVDDKLNGTYMRIESLPLSRGEFILGKLLSVSLSVFLQMLILIFFTSLIYRANWGNPALVLLVTALYSVTVGALALFLGLIATNQTSVSSYSALLLWGSSFLGGSFIRLDNIGGTIEMIHRTIPNGAALQAYIGIANGNGLPEIGSYLLDITLFAALFLILCAASQIKKGGAFQNAHTAKGTA